MFKSLHKKSDFEQVAKKGQSFFTKELGFKIIPCKTPEGAQGKRNNLKNNRYGIVVNLKVDKRAVVRNKIRRRIKEIIKLNNKNLKQGFDVMILVRESVKELGYVEIKERLIKLFKKAGLFSTQL